MMKKSIKMRFLSLGLAAAGFVLIGASFSQAQTQDPFSKPGWAKPRTAPISSGAVNSQGKPVKPKPPGPPPVVTVPAPGIEQRIAFYKQQREAAALNGLELPKVTSVMTLDEMAVIGIFRTPRGYAAMVQAKPINLSYTIYPGEKFFDGQLVAIEDNRLVFRRVTKMSNSKFIASVENKTLQQYSVEQEVQGTAPVPSGGKVEEASNTAPAPKEPNVIVVAPPTVVISPLDEMNRQPVEPPTKDSAKGKSDKKTDKKTDKKSDKAEKKSDVKTDKKTDKKSARADEKSDKKIEKKPVKVAENKKS